MPLQPPLSPRPVADFFTRALSSFRNSASKLQVICTAAPSPHRGGLDDGEPAALPPRVRPRTLIVLDSSFNPPTRAHLRMATSAIHALTHNQGQSPDALRLLLLLSVNNADKGAKPAAFDKRLAMMWAFARDVQHHLQTAPRNGQAGPGAEALSVDLGLATAPYFHEKSAALAESGFYSGEKNTDGVAETEQVFLVGYDTLIRIFNPKYYGPLESTGQVSTAESPPMQRALGPFFARSKLRVTMRTGDEWGGADEQTAYLQDLMQAEGLSKVGGNTDWAGRIEMVEGRKVGADIISSTYARGAAKERDSDRLDLMVTPEVRWWIEQGDLYTE
ncbi:hypothetical protein C8A01DRAFT_47533 [Parachaetomium inaequale]|uniref:Nicotinamide-nucleotide adenylyltransferase n=1 Tax=Parachaetomium inaequale TaxID=2588326 RepID=A0AAN6PF16_9PEZI|nr:hypothetical protein C8A01DRAFT_47533 [Parachaetomium inaequale]